MVRTAGAFAAAIGREAVEELLKDIVRRPERASTVMSHVRQAMPAMPGNSTMTSGRGALDAQRRYQAEQQEALVTAINACLSHIGVSVPKVFGPLFQDHTACGRLCEIFVDVLEEAQPQEERGCSAIIKSFLHDLNEAA